MFYTGHTVPVSFTVKELRKIFKLFWILFAQKKQPLEKKGEALKFELRIGTYRFFLLILDLLEWKNGLLGLFTFDSSYLRVYYLQIENTDFKS